LRVKVTGPEDPITEQFADFLSSSIKYIIIDGNLLSSIELSLCANLLRASAIENLQLISVTLNDTTISTVAYKIVST
ncbi:hypothetical protein PMAYCL1PPCAC_27163, partial [Pristionchus mayeri]